MAGLIRRKMIAAQIETALAPAPLVCPLCERPIPDAQKDAHHLVPKSKGGRQTEYHLI